VFVLIARRMEPERLRQFVSKATRLSSRVAFCYPLRAWFKGSLTTPACRSSTCRILYRWANATSPSKPLEGQLPADTATVAGRIL
jgi:hypothetical protein